MPELPDITVYIEALEERIVGKPVEKVRVASPFVVRSYDPPLRAMEGKTVRGLRRLGKRIVWELDDELFLVIHLMIAGRLRYKERGAGVPKKLGLCAFDFPDATLLFTEASKKKRASLFLARGEAALAEHDPGGIDVMTCSLAEFREALTRENHTLKRTMTDPHVFSGLGNAYSDEILHHARLSPVKWTTRLSDDESAQLLDSTRAVLNEWLERLRAERAGGFPDKVTAFHDEMAVHGRYKKPCPRCGSPVQRIVRGESEVNYCATCQTGGKLLADHALSRLLKGDWPKTLEELDERKEKLARPPAKPAKPAVLFAPGAGAPSTSEWMKGWAARLGAIGEVVRFDYPYMKAGKKRPDAHDKLVTAHREALTALGKTDVVLVGKSMGGRIGCHLALEKGLEGGVRALVCLGYPLVSPAGKRRDEVLLALRTPVLFVQGTRDALCPLDELAAVRARMKAPNALHVVESGDHSLIATKAWLKEHARTQDDVDVAILHAIRTFLAAHGGLR